METQARYGVVGVFVLAIIVAGFTAAYWLMAAGGIGQASYRIRFEGPVSGLEAGAPVLLNGVRIGEVTRLRLSPQDQRAEALIAVERTASITDGTRASVESQGIMSTPALLLVSGPEGKPLASGANGEPPTLSVAADASRGLGAAAGDVLKRLDGILTENAEPLNNTITKFSIFSDALARNAGRLDSIAEGLERMVGGGPGAKKQQPRYGLTAPSTFEGLAREPAAQISVAEPTALVVFDTQKFLISPNHEERVVFEDGQWSDSLPKLLQAKIVQSFENANYLKSVGRANDAVSPEYQLLIDIRDFQIALGQDPKAVVSFSAKIVDGGGKIAGARIFRAEAPVPALEAPAAARALDQAFGKAVTDLVLWANETI